MKITDEYYNGIAKEICVRNNYDYNKLKDICYNSDMATYYKKMNKKQIPNEIMIKDTHKLVPVLRIFNSKPYTYEVYDKGYLKNA